MFLISISANLFGKYTETYKWCTSNFASVQGKSKNKSEKIVYSVQLKTWKQTIQGNVLSCLFCLLHYSWTYLYCNASLRAVALDSYFPTSMLIRSALLLHSSRVIVNKSFWDFKCSMRLWRRKSSLTLHRVPPALLPSLNNSLMATVLYSSASSNFFLNYIVSGS